MPNNAPSNTAVAIIQCFLINIRLDFLKQVVRKIWKVLKGAETHVQELFPQLKTA